VLRAGVASAKDPRYVIAQQRSASGTAGAAPART